MVARGNDLASAGITQDGASGHMDFAAFPWGSALHAARDAVARPRQVCKDDRMFNYFRKEIDFGGRKLVLETGKVARQADGAVTAYYGDTIVLCTAVGVKTTKPGQDF